MNLPPSERSIPAKRGLQGHGLDVPNDVLWQNPPQCSVPALPTLFLILRIHRSWSCKSHSQLKALLQNPISDVVKLIIKNWCAANWNLHWSKPSIWFWSFVRSRDSFEGRLATWIQLELLRSPPVCVNRNASFWIPFHLNYHDCQWHGWLDIWTWSNATRPKKPQTIVSSTKPTSKCNAKCPTFTIPSFQSHEALVLEKCFAMKVTEMGHEPPSCGWCCQPKCNFWCG